MPGRELVTANDRERERERERETEHKIQRGSLIKRRYWLPR